MKNKIILDFVAEIRKKLNCKRKCGEKSGKILGDLGKESGGEARMAGVKTVKVPNLK